jgi:hypothetical protein
LLTNIKILAGVNRHGFFLLIPAHRAGNYGLQLNILNHILCYKGKAKIHYIDNIFALFKKLLSYLKLHMLPQPGNHDAGQKAR